MAREIRHECTPRGNAWFGESLKSHEGKIKGAWVGMLKTKRKRT